MLTLESRGGSNTQAREGPRWGPIQEPGLGPWRAPALPWPSGGSWTQASRPCLSWRPHRMVSVSMINGAGTADRALAGRWGVAVRKVGPVTAELFGLSLRRVILHLPVNSGLRGTQPHIHVLPNKGQDSEGRAGMVTARDAPRPTPFLRCHKSRDITNPKTADNPCCALDSIKG